MWPINPRIGVICLLLALGACDKPQPSVEAVPAPAEVVTETVADEVLEPVASQPEPVTKTTPQAPPKKPASVTKAQPQTETFKVPRLDLSVSPELLDALELGQPLPPEPLLPPLLGKEAPQDFRLNGRLIMSDEEDRMFDGAELQFEFKN